jgi:hypothetical protein
MTSVLGRLDSRSASEVAEPISPHSEGEIWVVPGGIWKEGLAPADRMSPLAN